MSTEPDTQSAAPTTVWPTFNYVDAPAAIRFLTEVIGFELTALHHDPGDETRITHAELWWPEGGGVMLGSANRGDSEFSHLPNGGCYVVTDNVRAVYGRVTAAHATVVSDLETTDYGSTQFVVADTEGVHWCFGTYRGNRSPSA